MNYIQHIQEEYPHLTRSEKKVADYILAVGNQVIYNTMSDIKQNIRVGDATIIRFCQKLGFSGFNDLKIAIAKEDLNKKQEKPKEKKYYNEIAENLVDSLSSTIALVNPKELEKALNYLLKARFIFIFGVGTSGNSAKDLESMLLRIGIQSKAVIDPHLQSQIASLATKNDLIITFSLSGKTKDICSSVQIGKENGCKIIAITNYLTSPLAQLSDIVLQTAIEEFLNGASLQGKVSQLFICEMLIQGYELKNNLNTAETREKVLRSILDKKI